jgi:cyanate permease
MLGLGAAVYFSFGLVSSAIAVLVTPIRADLGLTFSQMGVILGSWQLTYIAAAIPLGLLVDRMGLRLALTIGGLLMAASALSRAFAVDFLSMLLAVGLFGIGGPIVSIGLPKLVATWFPPTERGSATAVYITTVTIGSAVGLAATEPLLLPWLGDWRSLYRALALITALLALGWLLFGRDRPLAEPRSMPLAWRVALGGVARSPAVLMISIIGLTGFLISHGINNWLPQMLESRGFDPLASGGMATLPRLSAVLGGILAAQATRMLGGTAPAAALVLLLSTVGMASLLTSPPTAWLAAALLLLGLVTAAIMPLTSIMLMNRPEVGSERMGVAMGYYFAVGEIGGFGGPALLGITLDASGGFTLGIGLILTATLLTLLPVAWLAREAREARPG